MGGDPGTAAAFATLLVFGALFVWLLWLLPSWGQTYTAQPVYLLRNAPPGTRYGYAVVVEAPSSKRSSARHDARYAVAKQLV